VCCPRFCVAHLFRARQVDRIGASWSHAFGEQDSSPFDVGHAGPIIVRPARPAVGRSLGRWDLSRPS